MTIIHLAPNPSNELVSFKLSCLEDQALQQSFETSKGNQAKMKVSQYAKTFFQGQGRDKVCIGRVQPNATRFQDTLLLEVMVSDPTDSNMVGFVISPLLILSQQIIVFM